MESRKYYCCDNFDSCSWEHLLREVLPNAQFVEFNQLFLNEAIPNDLEWLQEFQHGRHHCTSRLRRDTAVHWIVGCDLE
jgi:hypothetical protein